MELHGGDYRKVLDHIVVRRVVLSEKNRIGIGTFQPKDEKSQDATELTGDINYRKLAEYGSESDRVHLILMENFSYQIVV